MVGIDGNFFMKAAYYREYWTRHGYYRADDLPITVTIEHSVHGIKHFWYHHNLWPTH
ncbi:DUF6610 family protein [Haloprofundus marisrubri]|uniref:DUF6610 family protein n=1 Tax=Haloprofundus marisrubri TaxID=1514971 RepID=UPI00373FD6E2